MISHEYASVLITLHELALFLSCSKLYVIYNDSYYCVRFAPILCNCL